MDSLNRPTFQALILATTPTHFPSSFLFPSSTYTFPLPRCIKALSTTSTATLQSSKLSHDYPAKPQWKASIDFKSIKDNKDAVAANIRNRKSHANLELVLHLYDQMFHLQKVMFLSFFSSSSSIIHSRFILMLKLPELVVLFLKILFNAYFFIYECSILY